MNAIVRSICFLLLFLPVAAPAAQGAEGVGDAFRVELEDLRKELRYEIDVLRKELEAVREAQGGLSEGFEEMARKVEQGGRAPSAPPARPGRPDQDSVYAIPVDGSPILGPTDAWITIVEVSDFQCPFCQRVQPTLDQIKDKYKGDVRFVFKHLPLPFHQRARPAAHAAECAGEQGQFWPMHGKLFEDNRALEDSDLLAKAEALQLRMKDFEKCLQEQRYESRIAKDEKTAANFGARGTPSFFVNGRYLAGAQPFPSFAAVIDEELAKAKKSGIAKSKYYEKAIIGKGKKKL